MECIVMAFVFCWSVLAIAVAKVCKLNNPTICYSVVASLDKGKKAYTVVKLIDSGVFISDIDKIYLETYASKQEAKDAMNHLRGS